MPLPQMFFAARLVLLPALLGAVTRSYALHAACYAWTLRRVANGVRGARKRSRWGSLGNSRSCQMPWKNRVPLPWCLFSRARRRRRAESCVRTWLPMCRVAAAVRRHEHVSISQSRRSPLSTSCSCRRIPLGDRDRPFHAVD